MFHIIQERLQLLNTEHDFMPTSIDNLVYLTYIDIISKIYDFVYG